MQTKANEAITGFFSAIINKITSLPGEVWNWLKSVISKVAEFGTKLGTKAKEAATGLFNNLVDGIKSLPDKIYSIGSDIVEGLWNGIQAHIQCLHTHSPRTASCLGSGHRGYGRLAVG